MARSSGPGNAFLADALWSFPRTATTTEDKKGPTLSRRSEFFAFLFSLIALVAGKL